jgi:hypothetical protein
MRLYALDVVRHLSGVIPRLQATLKLDTASGAQIPNATGRGIIIIIWYSVSKTVVKSLREEVNK